MSRISVPPAFIDTQLSANLREKRNKSRPNHLNDFGVKLPPLIDRASVTLVQHALMVHDLANFVSYDKFIDFHKAFLAAICSYVEPKNFNHVM